MTDDRPRLSNKKRTALFVLHGGSCHICGEKIDGTRERWEVEHVIPRSMLGGKLADTDDNMRPAHVSCHKEKTKKDKANLAKSDRVIQRHIGAKRSKSPMPFGRNSPWKKTFSGKVVPR